jgi:diamine N-acetyltransferase
VSLAQALFAPEAWYRAIHDGDTLVGFVMLWDGSITEPDAVDPRLYVWRLMVDAAHQRRGIGRRAMELVIAHVREHTRASKLLISYVPEDGGPEPLYRALGFVPTGEIDDGEVVMALPIAR